MGSEDESKLTADDVAGSVAARKALGPDAEEAVIQAFLERTGEAIDARVAERLADQQQSAHPESAYAQQLQPPPTAYPAGMPLVPPPAPRPPRPDRTPFALAMVSLLAGIPLTGIATQFGANGNSGGMAALIAVVVIWAGIVAVNVVYNRHHR